MYVQTFSVVVSQVKPGSQGPHNVLQFFLEVPKGVSPLSINLSAGSVSIW